MSREASSRLKRGLFVTGGIGSLLQFIQYYASLESPVAWDVLVHSYGSNSTTKDIYRRCRNLGVFESLHLEKGHYSFDCSTFSKAQLFMRMLGATISRRRREFARTYIESEIGALNPDLLVLYSDRAVISGCLIQAFPNQTPLVFEEGLNDYLPRYGMPPRAFFSLKELPYALVSRMGFGSVSFSEAFNYTLDATNRCVKFASRPDKLSYRRYKEIRSFAGLGLNSKQLETVGDLVARCWPELDSWKTPEPICLVLTTADNYPLTQEEARCALRRAAHLAAMRGLRCYLKRHPRDTRDYGAVLESFEILLPTVPAEAFCLANDVDYAYLLAPSSALLHFSGAGIEYAVLRSANAPKGLFDQFSWLIDEEKVDCL